MEIRQQQQRSEISAGSLAAGDHQVIVTPAQEDIYLGCWFDQQLSMGTQINKICSASYFHTTLDQCIYNKVSISSDSTEKLTHALVTNRIDYYNSLLYGLPQTRPYSVSKTQPRTLLFMFLALVTY